MNKELNLDTFGEKMNEFIENAEINMLITMPEGSIEAEVRDNCGDVSVLQFYIALNAVESIAKKMKVDMKIIDAGEWKRVVDSLMDLTRKQLLEVE